MKRIYVAYGVGNKIAKAMQCTPAEVSYALTFARDNETSRKIRKVAIEQFGGRLVELNDLTEAV